jgi:murein L,D-transpeptidase YafK
MLTKRLLIVISLFLSGLGLFVFGRSLWYPLYIKANGGKTVAEVVTALRAKRITDFDPTHWQRLILLGLKEEKTLEVWGIHRDGSAQKIHDFPFTGFSGGPGPKLREGDGQIPEGIYRIEYMNPNSSYHLSLKLDYPNDYDREKGVKDGRAKLGHDIFIHGRSATIGCIPIGNTGIEELFLMVAEMGKEKVEVILAPYNMRTRSKRIEVEGIDWEEELHSTVKEAILNKIPQDGIAR